MYNGLWSEQGRFSWYTYYVKRGKMVAEATAKYWIVSRIKAWLGGIFK